MLALVVDPPFAELHDSVQHKFSSWLDSESQESVITRLSSYFIFPIHIIFLMFMANEYLSTVLGKNRM